MWKSDTSTIDITNVGTGYTTATVDVKYSSPKFIGVGIGTTATGTATIQMDQFHGKCY